eukprot:13885886-Alexandrium_andersonii.AAC.1
MDAHNATSSVSIVVLSFGRAVISAWAAGRMYIGRQRHAVLVVHHAVAGTLGLGLREHHPEGLRGAL